MKRILRFLALPTAALVLEILPLGGVLKFSGPDFSQIKTVSYFDLTLWGYASFSPLITGLLTAAAVILGAICIVSKSKRAANVQLGVTFCGFITALLPALMGAEYLNIAGLAVALLLLGHTALGYIMLTKDKK